jgi:hypothetical protein
MIFNHVGYDWEKVLEEIKILSWRIFRARVKGFFRLIYVCGGQIL